MLNDAQKTGRHYSNSLCQSANRCSLNTLGPRLHSPSLQLFATEAKLLQKGAKVRFSLVRPPPPLALSSLGYPFLPKDIQLPATEFNCIIHLKNTWPTVLHWLILHLYPQTRTTYKIYSIPQLSLAAKNPKLLICVNQWLNIDSE